MDSFFDPFFAFIENSELSEWIRGSESNFAFPTIITLHAIGMAFLAGGSAAIDLRILGLARACRLRRWDDLCRCCGWDSPLTPSPEPCC
jgi:hypothetical protein